MFIASAPLRDPSVSLIRIAAPFMFPDHSKCVPRLWRNYGRKKESFIVRRPRDARDRRVFQSLEPFYKLFTNVLSASSAESLLREGDTRPRPALPEILNYHQVSSDPGFGRNQQPLVVRSNGGRGWPVAGHWCVEW